MLQPYKHPALQFSKPLPYGAILDEHGVQFSVFSRSATGMRLLLYDRVQDPDPSEVIVFDRESDRWGDVWSIYMPGISAGQLYHFQAEGPFDPSHGHRFDNRARLIDPYAQALAGQFLPAADGIVRPPKCVVVDEHFDWQGDRHLRRELSETVIYEMHVRGFTRGRKSGVSSPGTYLGLMEKIPYLQSLGVTAVELMPIHEFPTNDMWGQRGTRRNYWGYDPLAFFAPHRGYASGSEPGCQVREFKELVRALHSAGIEVILDVVFNHTAEGNELGPTLGFKGLENRVYYMLHQGRYYKNYSGCGNTVNGNHPVVRGMIFHCLRHWVHTYHVDGFRFDLASILSRGRDGNLIPNPPLVEMIAEDPMLADTKIIAEAWDAAGAFQVGSFSNFRWAEWNGHFRDDVRKFWRGDPHSRGPFATRLAGSSDLYEAGGRNPYHSINFVTSHDGFTLNDLVSYSHKHNEANGENNCDGDNNNHSCNYGVEGRTRRRDIEAVRERQIKNMLATLLLSQGVPMLLSGDECRRTQRGNNNAYCQDNSISWFNWEFVDRHADLLRFTQNLIHLRRREPALRRTTFLRGDTAHPSELPDVSWFAPHGQPIEWDRDEHSFMCLVAAPYHEQISADTESEVAEPHHFLLVIHAGTAPCEFILPHHLRDMEWRLVLNTGAPSPKDFYPDMDGPAWLPKSNVTLVPRSMSCFAAPR